MKRTLLLAPVMLFLLAFFAGPVVGFLAQGVLGRDGGLTAAPLLRFLHGGAYLRSLGISVRIALIVAALAVLLGYPVAYALAGMAGRRRATWLLLVLLPFWSSLLVRTFAWIVLLGRAGPLAAALRGLGLPNDLLYSLGAVLTGMTNVLTPFAILTMLGVMERIEPALIRAAGTLGARPVQAFFAVFLPLSLPGVAAAFLLVFIAALGFFAAPALLGSPQQTMITQLVIQQVIELLNWPFAAVLCGVLLTASLIAFILFDRVAGLSALGGGEAGRAGGRWGTRFCTAAGDVLARVLPARLPDARWAAGVVLAFLLLPLALMAPVSVSVDSFVSWPPRGFTLAWYGGVFASPAWADAALRSVLVALATATLCLVLVVPACLSMRGLSNRAATAVFAALVSPLIVPRLVIATGLFWLYARIGLVGTDIGLVLGHTVIALPYTLLAVAAVLRTHDWRLDAAAGSLGAAPWRVVRHVTLPLIGTGLAAASLFAFVTSFDELNVALFTLGGVSATLPKMMWDEATMRFSPTLAAVSTLVLLVMSGLVVLAQRLHAPRNGI
jgi:putative spermidine/putrescine transport system permease protein